ncbi:DUF3108 domain-containing protein [Acinetobacter sichuanensis]|uniref:DUF3108 domain-containing protein n=1 Tax=Acinetobacter sichuanensis TaxID=2136183 RepID=A0A371YS15_9GAMM|nr:MULTISPECIES: DUF3108 domain-containing protein [Acinetobacter]MDM1248173.1 DUF3108 domain-containing protein [Acinetobacter sp. R933-2]RFC84276.1 DUF3108 domain-containing protein [Acinetobacter sichuanensis]
MAAKFIKTLSIATGLSTALLLTGFSSNALAMSPFQATYQFSYNGKNMGSATRTLSKNGNNWNYVFAAKAAAIASATESSNFTLSNGQIQSNSFSRTSKILVHNDTMSIKFNPNTKTINTNKSDKARSFAWKTGALDELNAELQVREDLKGSGLKSSYLIADAKGLDTRHFVKQGNESVKTAYGTFDTVKVVLTHDNSAKQSIFWLAPKLDYLPVKMSHQDGKTSYSLSLTGYKN